MKDLWPEDIGVTVLTPLQILRYQASRMGERAKGLLDAEVTVTAGKDKTALHLDLIAPVLNGYRHRILVAQHANEMVYPVTVWADCYEPPNGSQVPHEDRDASIETSFSASAPNFRRAVTDGEFVEVVGQVLRSTEGRGVISSLIARSNEQKPPALASPEGV